MRGRRAVFFGALRSTSFPRTTDAAQEVVAEALYRHEMATYDGAPGHATNVEAFWLDPDMRAFWLERASVAIDSLTKWTPGLDRPVVLCNDPSHHAPTGAQP